MGICLSVEQIKAHEHSKQIDRYIASEAGKKYRQKLLLLGPAESGKSTCVKQMKILHNNGFTDYELQQRKCIVYSNIVRSMYELTLAMIDLGLRLEDPSLENYMNMLKVHVENGHEFTLITVPVRLAVQALWKDAAIKAAYDQRLIYHIHDSAAYFFEHIERISEKDYCPTNQDMLMTRMPTTGVVRITFTLRGIEFHVFDVGGQRSERRKWIHCFDDVNTIIFIAAINEYDQKLREDNRTNRLIEALELFEDISNSKLFAKTSMILFLNKKDLFEEKIQRVSLNVLFPSYRGGLDYEQGVMYLREKFRKLYRNKKKLYIHETFATDTQQINAVFTSVLAIIFRENVHASAII